MKKEMMKEEIKEHEDRFIHVPKSWYVPCMTAMLLILLAVNAWYFWNLKLNSGAIIIDAVKQIFESNDQLVNNTLQILGFGVIAIALEIIYGTLIGRLKAVLFGVFFGVLFGMLFGALYGVLGGALGGVLFGVFFGMLVGVLVGVLYGND